jgi:polysaccharide deacetylase family protein (PEP-CTERM system associated)
MSFDVEDYFQVQALTSAFPRASWNACPSRVERNTDVLLSVLAETETKATFFTLGWIAERYPAMVRRIVSQGHELGSHGYAHFRVDSQSPDEFRADVRKSKRILEDCTGVEVTGYRAATFSVSANTPWAFPILEEQGYRYSSSIYPVHHDNYSYPDAPRTAFRPQGTSDFWEFPISTLKIGGRNIPCGGGGYFRLLPYQLTRLALRRIVENERTPVVFYLHPWEVDPDQPRPTEMPLKSRIRHYLNLGRTEGRLRRLLTDFRWAPFADAFPQLREHATTTPSLPKRRIA